ncbi:MAG: hypothetical protein ACYTGH_11680, partial [Planctomycetota bacterium]
EENPSHRHRNQQHNQGGWTGHHPPPHQARLANIQYPTRKTSAPDTTPSHGNNVSGRAVKLIPILY